MYKCHTISRKNIISHKTWLHENLLFDPDRYLSLVFFQITLYRVSSPSNTHNSHLASAPLAFSSEGESHALHTGLHKARPGKHTFSRIFITEKSFCTRESQSCGNISIYIYRHHSSLLLQSVITSHCQPCLPWAWPKNKNIEHTNTLILAAVLDSSLL